MNNLVINLNKPKDITSQQAVTKIKRLFGVKKAGHAGTLDPIATGVLLVCLNEATKITRFLSDLDKEYLVQLKLGESTDTYDSTGKIVEKTELPPFDKALVHRTVNRFVGRVKQIPPIYSALKVKGKPLYKLARKGMMAIEIPERTVEIHSINLMRFSPPYLELKIQCSKGTYIRTLCNDIGRSLGVGAHMVSLERTRIGKFSIENSATLDEVISKCSSHFSIDSALSHLDEIILDENNVQKIRHGMPLLLPLAKGESIYKKTGFLKIKDINNKVLGIGKIEDNILRIERLLN